MGIQKSGCDVSLFDKFRLIIRRQLSQSGSGKGIFSAPVAYGIALLRCLWKIDVRKQAVIAVGLALGLTACGGGGGGGGSSSGTGTGTFDPNDTTAPQIIASSPGPNATGVALDVTLTVTFDEDVIAASAEVGVSVKRTSDSSVIFGTATYNSSTRTVSFVPNSPLAEYTQYTVSVSSVSDFSGNYISTSNPIAWVFTTQDLTPPVTTASKPAGLYNTALNITLNCSDTAGSGCATTYYSTNGATPTTVYSGPIPLGEGNFDLKFYSVDNAGLAEAVQTVSYQIDLTPPQVSPPPTPAVDATGAAANTDLAVTFSEGIDEATLGSTSFSLDNNMSGTVGYDALTHTATFTPTTRLKCATLYTATIASSVSDPAGNTMAADYTWSFTTHSDCTAPQTTATPDGGVTNGTNVNVTLTCSDAGSGCSRIVYTTDGSMPSFEPLNGTVVSGTSAGPLSFGVGDTTLRYYAEDAAGNREVLREKIFSVSNTGFLYVATDDGLARGAGPVPDSFITQTGGEATSHIFRDASNGRLYALGKGGLAISDNDGQHWSYYTIDSFCCTVPSLNRVFADGSRVFVGMGNSEGLLISEDSMATEVRRKTSDGLGGNNVSDIYANDNVVYAATNGGLSISNDYGVSFVNRTTADGLGSNTVYAVYVDGSNVYAATDSGLAVSSDGGVSFNNRTTTDGLGSNFVYDVYASGSNVYAATGAGVSVSGDSGASFANVSLGGVVRAVYVNGSNVYAVTSNGLSISTDGGSSFPTTRTMADGLLTDQVNDIYGTGNTLYLATANSLSISRDGGNSFENNGLPDNSINGIYAAAGNVYAATSGGLAISTDGGATFTARSVVDGLGDKLTTDVIIHGGDLYVGTIGGLSVSTNGGSSFTNYTTLDGLGSNSIKELASDGTDIYIATGAGLSLPATSGPNPYQTLTTADGLPADNLTTVACDSGNVYIGTYGSGIAYSSNGGANWTIRNQANAGLVSDLVHDIHASGSFVHIAGAGSVSYSNDGGLSFVENSAYAALGGGASSHAGGQGIYVYIEGFSGLYLSSDNGTSFVLRDETHGLPLNSTIWDTFYAP